MATFKKLDTVTVTNTGKHGIVMSVGTYQGEDMVYVRFHRTGEAYGYKASAVERYTVQSPDTIYYMDDMGVMWPYEVLDVSADGKSVYVYGETGYDLLLISTATLIVPASMMRIARAMGGR